MISTDDLASAGVAILRAKHYIDVARPQFKNAIRSDGLDWNQAKDLLVAGETLAYYAELMRNELLKRCR